MMLFAVHLPDYFLPLEWCVAGYLAAAPLVAMGCWRLHERDVPRVALATAAFFIASSIHIPVPMSSVHLVLNGFVGILLGFRAGLALAVGLLYAVWRPDKASGLLPFAAALAGTMALTAGLDVAAGRQSVLSESHHVLEVIGLALLVILARPTWRPTGNHPFSNTKLAPHSP